MICLAAGHQGYALANHAVGLSLFGTAVSIFITFRIAQKRRDTLLAQVWLLNFELLNFWLADLRRSIDGLPADLNLQQD